MTRPFDAVVRSTRMITPTVRALSLARADGAPLVWVPGQYIQLHFDQEGARTFRSYSMSTPPSADGTFEVAVALVPGGAGSAVVAGLQVGDRVPLSGPWGRFVLRPGERPSRLILVATGTGVSPYLSMRDALAVLAGQGTRVSLLLGVRSEEDIPYRAELEALRETEGVTVTVCFSRTTPDPIPTWGRAGRVDAALASLEPKPSEDVVYLCGNPAMVDAGVESLRGLGFAPTSIRREKYETQRPG